MHRFSLSSGVMVLLTAVSLAGCNSSSEGDSAPLVCESGTANCDGSEPNGCETTLGSLENCGACGDACAASHAAASCDAGHCTYACDGGFDDCDGDASNGCETPLDTVSDCGVCGARCAEVHGTAQCVYSGCELTCDAGYDDCDHNPATGCEAPLNTPTHCGSCGVSCNAANGTASCGAGGCEIVCNPGFADCDGDVTNGCEADLSSPTTCGSCSTLCTGACVDGSCAACDAGLAIDSVDPLDAAKAMGLCGGVAGARWVLPDGSALDAEPNYDIGHGMLSAFGPNVSPREGARLLALSSGAARPYGETGYQSPSGYDKGYTCGSPAGFPKESPACPGVVTGQPHDGVALEVDLEVPATAVGFAFNFDFYTYEWPAYVCDTYNDFFTAILSPTPAGQPDGNISFDAQGNPVSVNNAFLEVCNCAGGPPCTAGGKTFTCALGSAPLAGTGFGVDTEAIDHAATGWLVTAAPVTPISTITLRFAVYDSGDGIFDSSVLLDNFRWLTDSTSVVTVPDPNP